MLHKINQRSICGNKSDFLSVLHLVYKVFALVVEDRLREDSSLHLVDVVAFLCGVKFVDIQVLFVAVATARPAARGLVALFHLELLLGQLVCGGLFLGALTKDDGGLRVDFA
jgi:hypothetical protein